MTALHATPVPYLAVGAIASLHDRAVFVSTLRCRGGSRLLERIAWNGR